MSNRIQLIAGLGNPGPEYAATRHNAGFWWLETLAHQWGVQLAHSRDFHGFTGSPLQQGHKVWLLQPTIFMNRSGQSVAALARFYKIPPENILVVHDELDLDPGQVKLKQGGGHAGHNGLRDIDAQLGSKNYWRLRLGIGHPGNKSEVTSWVLKKAPSDQQQAIEESIAHSLKAWPLLVAGEMDKATAQINTNTPPRPKPPRQERKEQS